MAVARFPESQYMAEQVLTKLAEVYERLLSSQKSSGDVEVTKYCDVLSRFQRYLRTPASDISVARFARSRKVADSNHLFRSDLDRLMDLLLVSESDPLRCWGSMFEAINEEESDGDVDEASREDKQTSDAITLVNFDTALVEKVSSEPNPSHTSHYPWLLPLNELIFNESDTIGEGAFGAVYKGMWLDTPVVVKFMGYEEDHGKSSTRLFLHEVKIWHQLNHPHIVKLYGANHLGKRYFVCEYASSRSLPEFLNRPQSSTKTWQKLYETALGLEYLHGLNVVHNDLKCDNILIGADGRAKLIDFGLSSIPNVAEIQVDVKRMGALHWKSPEYLAGERPAFTSDIYSLAMCVLEVVTGDIPWGRNMNPTMVKLQVRKGCLPPRPAVMGPTQWNLVELMTKHDPKHRVKIAFVVDKLHELAQEEASAETL
ncbi:Tkl protein kinase [Globisporangium polare]